MSSCTSAACAVSASDISLACHVHQGGGGSSFGSFGGLGEFETYMQCNGATCLYGYNNCKSNSSNSCATVTSTSTNCQATNIGAYCGNLMYVDTNIGATASAWRVGVIGTIRDWHDGMGSPEWNEHINGYLFKVGGQDCARWVSNDGCKGECAYKLWDITDDGTLCCVAYGLAIAMNTNCIVFCTKPNVACSNAMLTVF